MDDVPVMQTPPDARVRIDGKTYVYFGGTSYLGLHARPEPAEAACEAIRRLGVHTATTRTGFGNSGPLLELEREAAAFFEAEAAVTLPSGYLTMLALLKTLAGDYDVLIVDEASHFAVRDAARAAGLPERVFGSCDAEDLARSLRELPADARPLVLSDGLFPMGRIAPLRDYLHLLEPFARAGLVVDDAHGFGTLGDRGRGTAEHHGLADRVNRDEGLVGGTALYVGGTLSKALGGYGGVIAGEATFVEQLRRSSEVFAGASALPTAEAAASLAALRILSAEPGLLQRLRGNVQRVRAALAAIGLPVDTASPSPIAAITLDSAQQMRRVHERLRSRGVIVPYIARYSGLGTAGALRIAVGATHTAEMIATLADELHAAIRVQA